MADAEEITITVPDEEGVAPAVEAKPAPPPAEEAKPAPPAKESDDPEAGIAALRKQLAQEQDDKKQLTLDRKRYEEAAQRAESARMEAERRAQENAGRAERSYSDAERSQYDSIVNAAQAAEREHQNLQARLPELYEKSDYTQAAKVQADLSKVAARLVTLETAKYEIDERRKQQIENPRQAPPSTMGDWHQAWNAEQYNSYINSRTAKTAAWLRRNDRFASDPMFRNKVTSADGYVVNVKGISRDSDEYFTAIEEAIGVRETPRAAEPTAAAVAATPAAAAPTSAAAVSTPRSSPTPAAPPSRKTPTSDNPGGGGTQVVLTSDERQMAHILFPRIKATDPDPEVVYARNRLALEREGKIGKGARDGR